MQRNEVIDLSNYREGEGEGAEGTLESAMDELPPGTRLLHGQYEITGYLNSGGFGITYRAKDSLERDVVIKECFPGVMCNRVGQEVRVRSKAHAKEFSGMVSSFVKEAHALAAMDHKNIVKVHQVFEENGTAYMAIDFIDGRDLLDVIDEQPDRLGPREIERLAKKTLRAIKYIHDRGMLHRDISPDNILLDADDEPILIDFGAAREQAKQTGRVMSRMKFVKDGYSPQEFYVEGSEQGPYSDLYSFAASLYHLICGEPPVEGQQRLAALAQKKPDPNVPLQGRIKGYTRGFLQAVDKSLDVVPQNRFQTAEEWLSALTTRSRRNTSRITSRQRSEPLQEAVQPSEQPEVVPDRLTSMISGLVAETSADIQADAKAERIAKSKLAEQAEAQAKADADKKAARAKALMASEPVAKAETSAPPLTERAPEIQDETTVRESLKAMPVREPKNRSMLMLGVATAAIISVVGTVGLIVFGGSESDPVELTAPTPTAIETPSQSASANAAEEPDATAEQEALIEIAPIEQPSTTDAAVAAVLSPADTTIGPVAPLEEASRPPERPDSLTAAPDNDAQYSALASNQSTEDPAPVLVNPADLVSNIAPEVAPLDAAGVLAAAPVIQAAPAVGASEYAAVVSVAPIDPLIGVKRDSAPNVNVAAPAPPPVNDGPLVSAQVQYSHWDVAMPFASDLVKLRNADTVRITDVAREADLATSGEWIAPGVTIYTYNGERLQADTPLSVHVLTSMNIDPDGYARGSVRYQPEGGTIDRGLLAVPVFREIGLADGTILNTRVVDRAWVTTVMAVGDTPGTTIRVGDVLVRENTTGVEFVTHEEVNRAFEILVDRDVEFADFNVVRNGTTVKASYGLSREVAG